MKKRKVCSVKGCDRDYYAKGMCRNHRTRFRYENDPVYKERVNSLHVVRGKRYYDKKLIENPKFYAQKSANWRKKNPSGFHYGQCVWHFRKLTKVQKIKLLKSCMTEKELYDIIEKVFS